MNESPSPVNSTIPDTYFEFVLGYGLLWLILITALLYALLRIHRLTSDLKDLEAAQKNSPSTAATTPHP